MKNALRTEGADALLTSTRPAGLAVRLATSRPPQLASQRWKAFALLVLTYIITIVDFTIVNVALPTIGRELRFPESDLLYERCGFSVTAERQPLPSNPALGEVGMTRPLRRPRP